MLAGGSGAAGRGAGGAAAMLNLVRQFSRKCQRNLKKIDPKVPREEAVAISGELYRIIKEHGPLTVSNTWNHAKVCKFPIVALSCLSGLHGLENLLSRDI